VFKLLFNENINYGYHRNIYGLKWVGIALNLLSAAAACAIFYFQPAFAALSDGKFLFLGILAFIHFIYFVFGVSRSAMLEASSVYARQLLLSSETLIKLSREKAK